ncbi:hypothetical protein N7471_008924 [Penicillium samsonianum]|uniref:uncharacterized protein n=1 Tax=Penicillium samsonianum TaxID=1882272 RepID=UPI00254786C1|nr:uncharacterized protein N7471_008924 [Penicillium samsonianum]KAJ6127707.1 hypothetical protein N7471_008924 [Penicillium samsonianum]
MKQPIHQQFLSDCHINTEKNLLKSQHLPRPYSSPESKAISEKARRKRAHNLIEKRSRENLNLKFLELEKVLSRHRGPGQNKDLTPDNTPKRKKRLAILDRAHNNILELEAEVQSLKQKIKTLRDIAFPETCRFTLPVD